MKKMPFTQAGLDAKKEELYKLSESEFRAELKEIQNNTSNWVKNNFTLNVEQSDYLNSMPKEILAEIGLSTAIAIDYKLKLTLETPTEAAARIRLCSHTEASASFHADWSEGSPPVIRSWNFTLTFSL
ncbi:MAG: hypothetical protein GY739_15425 [Mesoflavibacter sp.]|nr:hypothetical protein [Mesoflavibacter sp.]